jgi:heme/copper-type cytochrome/quinol oxidase subunit 2
MMMIVVVVVVVVVVIGTPAVLVLQYIYRNKMQAGRGDQQMDYEYVIILWTALHKYN